MQTYKFILFTLFKSEKIKRSKIALKTDDTSLVFIFTVINFQLQSYEISERGFKKCINVTPLHIFYDFILNVSCKKKANKHTIRGDCNN